MQTKSSILRKVKNGLSLAELSEALRNDFEIAQEAVRQNWREMNFLSENLQKKLYHIANHYFSIEVAMKPEVFKEASIVLKQNRSLTLELVAKDGMLLAYALPKFQDDFDVVITAVKESWESIAFASDYLQVDYDIYYAMKQKCIESLKEDGLMLKHLPKCHISEEIALVAVQNNGLALQYVPNYMRGAYKSITKAALKNNELALQFATEHMYHDF